MSCGLSADVTCRYSNSCFLVLVLQRKSAKPQGGVFLKLLNDIGTTFKTLAVDKTKAMLSWNDQPEYDANVLAPTSGSRKGYEVNLLAPAPAAPALPPMRYSAGKLEDKFKRPDDVAFGRHGSLSGQTSNPEGADAAEDVEPKVATNSKTPLSTEKQKLYRTKNGIIIIILIAIVIVAAIIGGAVGGVLMHKNKNCAPSTPSPSICITDVYLDTASGSQTINCNAYSNRLADLQRGEANQPIIGFHSNGGWNQKWTFHKQGICGKYTISTQGGGVLYANSNNLLGAVVYATSVYTIFTVETTSDGNYKIGIQSSNGTILYWTLANEAEETQVILQADNGSPNQVWAIRTA